MAFKRLFPQVSTHHLFVIPDIDVLPGEGRMAPDYACPAPVQLGGRGFDQTGPADHRQSPGCHGGDQQLSVFIEHPGSLSFLNKMDVLLSRPPPPFSPPDESLWALNRKPHYPSTATALSRYPYRVQGQMPQMGIRMPYSLFRSR
jgi:hypothetical protein